MGIARAELVSSETANVSISVKKNLIDYVRMTRVCTIVVDSPIVPILIEKVVNELVENGMSAIGVITFSSTLTPHLRPTSVTKVIIEVLDTSVDVLFIVSVTVMRLI